MKTRHGAILLALIAAIAIAGTTGALSADEGDDLSEKVAEIMGKVKVSLADAAGTAEKKTGGRAIEAELEAEDDEIVYDVVVVVTTDGKVSFREVEIDAVTGKVLDDEEYGPGDDDEDETEDDSEDE